MASKKISSLILLVVGEGVKSLGGRRFDFKFDFCFRYRWSCWCSRRRRRWSWVFQLYPLVGRFHAVQTKTVLHKFYRNKSFEPDWKICDHGSKLCGSARTG